MGHEDWRAEQSSVRIEVGYHEFDVAYREIGSGDPATVFVHGIPTWGYLYNEVCEAVDHAIVLDMPGYGYTEHLGNGEYDRSVRTQEEYLLAFLDALDLETVQLVAHDIGGGVALRTAVHTDRVERLVLSNAVCYDNFPDADVPPLGTPDKTRNETYSDVHAEMRAAMTDRWGPLDGFESDDFLEAMTAPFADDVRNAKDWGRNAIATNTNDTAEIAAYHDRISAPTLLLWGYPGLNQHVDWAEKLAEDVPDTRMEVLEGSGHWVMQERPDAYRKHLGAFLE